MKLEYLYHSSNKATAVAVVAVAALSSVGAAAPAQALGTVWDRVAACESTGNWSINTGNGFYGGVQFTNSTWIAFGGGAYASNAHQASKAAQILIAQRVLAAQGPGAWPVCSVKAGLTRSNGGSQSTSVPVARPVASTAGKLTVDGVMGPLTQASMNRHGVRLTTSALVRAWQTRLRVTVDGRVGPQTIKALQVWLNAQR